MKIIFFINSLLAGGMERQLIELIKSLKTHENRYNVIVVVMNENVHYNELFKLNVKVIYLVRKSKKDILIFNKFFKICKEFKPNIIHTWDTLTSFYATPVAAILKIKLINGSIRSAPQRNSIPFKVSLINFLTYPFATKLVANSLAGLNSYRIKKNGVLIYNGFDMERTVNLLDKNKVRDKYNVSTKYVVGMVASFTNGKDYQTFIKAAILIIDERSDVTFMAVGDGYDLDYCKKLVPEHYLSRIIFTGNLNDVESIINIFDIGILLSVYREGISNSIMECMSLGKPVIATMEGGTDEIVVDNISGYTIEPFNPLQLVEKVTFLLDNEETAKQMGRVGKEIIVTKFSVSTMMRKYLDLYEALS